MSSMPCANNISCIHYLLHKVNCLFDTFVCNHSIAVCHRTVLLRKYYTATWVRFCLSCLVPDLNIDASMWCHLQRSRHNITGGYSKLSRRFRFVWWLVGEHCTHLPNCIWSVGVGKYPLDSEVHCEPLQWHKERILLKMVHNNYKIFLSSGHTLRN